MGEREAEMKKFYDFSKGRRGAVVSKEAKSNFPTWDYRVMRRVVGKGATKWYSYGIYELYNSPAGWTKEPVDQMGQNVEELRKDLEWMLEALDKPVLDYETGEPIKPTGP